MPHLIKSFPSSNFSNPNFSSPVSFDEALRELRKAHEYLIKRSHNGIKSTISIPTAEWGIRQKRSIVNLRPRESRPDLIEKDDEKLVEVINIAATLERLMDAIEWFAADPSSRAYKISECHPSTSDAKKKEPNSASNSTSNDLVLVNGCGETVIRCEICDVVSSKRNCNGKAKKDLKNLGCGEFVPQDAVTRYVITSDEFGNALARHAGSYYQYTQVGSSCLNRTRLLRVDPVPPNDGSPCL